MLTAESINELAIYSNTSLSSCEAQSVCEYIASPNGTILIQDNNTGCNTQQEVETACDTVGISNFKIEEGVSIFPNPASETISIKILSNLQEKNNHTIEIMKLTGETVISHLFDGKTSTISLKGLSSGIYIYTIKTNNEILKRGKLIKQ